MISSEQIHLAIIQFRRKLSTYICKFIYFSLHSLHLQDQIANFYFNSTTIEHEIKHRYLDIRQYIKEYTY